jgi:two-component system, cell cycle sensor histidine kinase and response regulator CckA
MAPPRFLSPYRLAAVGLVFLLGVLISVAAWRYAARQDDERLRTGFLSRAQTQASVASQHLRAYQEMVHSLRDSFLGQNIVTREEFANVSRSLLARHPGVQALQWVRIIPHAQRAAFEAEMQRELGQPFVIRRRQADDTLRPAGEHPEYFVITYLEPHAGNEVALGYDVLTAPSEPMLTAARQDRRFKVSRTFRLAQSRPDQHEPGVVFLLPYWRGGTPDQPVEGFVQGVFLVQTMLAQSHDLTTNEALDTYYFDVEPGREPELLYANLGGTEPLREPGRRIALPPLDQAADFHTTLTLGERTWRMVIHPNEAWLRASRSRQPHAILAAGLLITVLFTGFINNLFVRTTLIEAQVQERTRQLRASEARLQDILDHSPAIIFLKDLEGRYLLCNRAFAEFCGRPPADIIGRQDAELFLPEGARLARANDARVLAAGRPMEFEESTLNPADRRSFIAHKFPLLDEQGRTYALCGIATDITERKAAEEQKLALERKLLEAQKLESLGVLAGGIAHDFNNILTSILGNTTLAAMDLPEAHRARRQLTQIERAAQRAADLCAQMLAYAGRASFVTVPLNLSRLVHDTAALLEVSVGRRVRLELLVDDTLPAVMGDPTQLRQIVMNLVINAADSLGDRTDGHVVVRTFTRDLTADDFRGAVHSPKLPAGRYVGLEVSDNGCGMPPEILARIFEPFFTTKFSGRGLGLAAARGIVQRHDGALFVETAPGRGTCFRLFLPVTAATAADSTAPLEPAAGALHGTVLVVDDEEPVREVSREALTALGLTVIEAADGAAALARLQENGHGIRLVLLDLTMPGLPGDETLRRLRQTHPDLPVVVMSGYSEGETMQRCASLGVAGFLPKPFDVAALTARLRPHLG